jgi:selenide,water dikinase
LTDITGYGLLGHGYEMAAASGVAFRFEASRVPLLPGALQYADRGIVTGGAARNRQYLAGKARIADGITEALEHVLFDPQTSGGLMFPVSAEHADEVDELFAAAGETVWRVGEVVEGEGVEVLA